MSKIKKNITFETLLAPDFFEMINDAVFFFDYSLRFIFVNKKGIQLVGKSKKELLGKSVTSVFPEVKKKSIYIEFLKVKKFSKTPFEYYSPSMKKWLAVKVYPTKCGIGVYARDITDIKLAEERAKVNKEILTAFFDNSPVGLAIYDEKMKILNIDNASANTFFGKKSKDVIGKPLKELTPKNAEIFELPFQNVLQDHKPLLSEISIKDKHGNILYCLSSLFPLVFSNGLRGVGTITIDITDMVRNEQKKDDFIAIASHELRTPLTSALIYVQLLKKRFEKHQEIESVKLLQDLDEKIKHFEKIIKEIIDARLYKNRLNLKKEKFKLKDLALKTIANLQTSTKHTLKVKWENDEYLFADKEKVSQILMNFITNAIKYSPEKKKIIIRSQKSGDFVVISVQDFGIGIPKEDQQYIFNRFYQVNKNSKYPGIGLGLYIAKAIISDLGGQVWLISEEGQGSTFYFSLPIYNRQSDNLYTVI